MSSHGSSNSVDSCDSIMENDDFAFNYKNEYDVEYLFIKTCHAIDTYAEILFYCINKSGNIKLDKDILRNNICKILSRINTNANFPTKLEIQNHMELHVNDDEDDFKNNLIDTIFNELQCYSIHEILNMLHTYHSTVISTIFNEKGLKVLYDFTMGIKV